MQYIQNEGELVDVLNFLRINPISTIRNLKDHLTDHLNQLDIEISDLQNNLLYMKKVRDRINNTTNQRKQSTVQTMLEQSNPNLLRYQEIAKNASDYKKTLEKQVAYVPSDLIPQETTRNMQAVERIASRIGDMTRSAISTSLSANDINTTLDLDQIQAERIIKLQANEIVGILGEKQRVSNVLRVASGAEEIYDSMGSKGMTLDELLNQSVDYLLRIFNIG